MQMAISHLKTAPFQGTLFIFFKQETDTARSSFPHYSCKRSVTSLCGGDRMAFSGSIKARERPCTQKKKRKTVSDRKGEKLREKETQNRGRTEGLKAEKKIQETERGGRQKKPQNRRRKKPRKNWGKEAETQTEKKPGGRGENKLTFVPLFLLKETEEIKEKKATNRGREIIQRREQTLASHCTFIIVFFQASVSRDSGCNPFPPNRQTQGQPKETERGGDWERKKLRGQKSRGKPPTRPKPLLLLSSVFPEPGK